MGSVGNLYAKLGLKTQDFSDGIRRAQKEASSFGGMLAKVASPKGAVDGIHSLLGATQKLATSLPFVGAAFAALPITGGGFFEWIKGGMDRINEVQKSADRLGLSVKSLSAYSLLAGVDAEQFTHSLGHLNKELGLLSAGDREATGKFTKLGFDTLYMSSVGADKAIEAVGKRIRELPTAAEKAALSMQLFGRGGAEMLTFLNKSQPEIDAVKEKMERLGISFDRIGGKEVKTASIALKEIDLVLKGLQTQLAIQLSPYIGAAAKQFNNMADNGKNMGEVVTDSLEQVTAGLATAVDWSEKLNVFWQRAKLDTQERTLAFAKLMNAPILNLKLHRDEGFDIALDEDIKAVKKQLDQLNQIPDRAAAVAKAFEGIRNKARAAAKAAIGAAGGNGPGLDAGEKLAEMMKKADALNAEDPLEKFKKSLDDLNDMVKAGVIDWDHYYLAIGKALKGLEGVNAASTVHNAALEQGSSAEVTFRADQNGQNVQRDIREILKQANELQKQQVQGIRDLVLRIGNAGAVRKVDDPLLPADLGF